MVSPSQLRSFLAFCVVLLVSLSLTSHPCDAISVVIPSPATGPYFSPNLPESADIAMTTLRITGGPRDEGTSNYPLLGTAVLSITPHGGSAMRVTAEQAAAGEFDVAAKLILPNSADSQYGCLGEGQSFADFTDEGDPLAGNILLIERRGGCPFQPKIEAASAKHVAGVIIYNCLGCEDSLARLEVESWIPTYFMTQQDGYMLRDAIRARRAWLNGTAAGVPPVQSGVNYSEPIIGTFVGTGPLVPDELNTLRAIARDLTLHSVYDLTWQREWTELLAEDPATIEDPCGSTGERIAGIWCERGHVVSIYLKYLGIEGTISPAFGQLTELRDLSLSGSYPNFPGLSGTIPPELCALTKLRSFTVDNNVLTDWADCFGTRQTQLVYLQADHNRFARLPSGLGAATELIYLVASRTDIAEMPTWVSSLNKLIIVDLSQARLAGALATLNFTGDQLLELRLNDNQLSGSIPSTFLAGVPHLSILALSRNLLTDSIPSDVFTSGTELTQLLLSGNELTGELPTTLHRHTALTSLDLSANRFTGELSRTLFDAMTGLTTVALDRNQFRGAPPDFAGCTSLASINLEHNELSQPPSMTWADSSLPIATVRLSYNNFTSFLGSSMDVFAAMTRLESLYFDHNQLVTDEAFNIGQAMFKLVGPKLTTLALQNNNLTGPYPASYASMFSHLQSLNLSTNFLTSVPEDFFLSITGIIHLDLSSNRLTGRIPEDITTAPGLSSLFVHENRDLLLPTFVVPKEDGVYQSGRDQLYECLAVHAPQFPNLQIKADPSALAYANCRCKQSAFGTTPECQRVPGELTILPFDDADDEDDHTPSPLLRHNHIALDAMPPAFGPGLYLPQPLGLTTSWKIDLKRLRHNSSSGNESVVTESLDSTTVKSDATLQPVRVLLLRLHISRAHFRRATDVLSVLNTQAQFYVHVTGAELNAFVDRYPSADAQGVDDAIIHTSEYATFYNSSLSALVDPVLVEFVVPGNDATITFSTESLAAGETPFIGTYSWRYSCPRTMKLLNADLGNQCLAVLHDQFIQGRNGSYTYECPALTTLSSPVIQALTDPRDINYLGCRCSKGTFGVVPYCDLVPVNAIVSPYQPPMAETKYAMTDLTTPELLDWNITHAGGTGSGSGSGGGSQSFATSPASFTDLWYGSQRLMSGVSTSWAIDLRDLRRPSTTLDDATSELQGATPLDASLISGSESLQPVRQIDVLLHVSAKYFVGAGNLLTVSEGTTSGERVFSLTGEEVQAKCMTMDEIMSKTTDTSPLRRALSPSYQSRYSIPLAALVNPYICSATVSSNQASVSFTSRDSSEAHFVSTYSYMFTCPIGLELDDDTNRCALPGTSGSAALAVILSVSGFLLLLSFGWVIRERYTRQKHKQRLARLSTSVGPSDSDATSSDASIDDNPDRMKEEILRGQSNELRKELIGQVASLVVEFGLTIATWVNVGLLAKNEGSQLGNSYLNVAYIAVSIVALMGFTVNAIARFLSIQALREELHTMLEESKRASVAKSSGISENAIQLKQATRRVTQLKIVSIAILFDSAPLLLLNILRVAAVVDDGGSIFYQYFFQCLIGSLLIGVKLTRLANLPALRRNCLELRLKIWEERMTTGRQTRGASQMPNSGKARTGTVGMVSSADVYPSQDVEIMSPSKPVTNEDVELSVMPGIDQHANEYDHEQSTL